MPRFPLPAALARWGRAGPCLRAGSGLGGLREGMMAAEGGRLPPHSAAAASRGRGEACAGRSLASVRGEGGRGGAVRGLKSSGQYGGSRLFSKVGFNLSLLIINSCSPIACRDLDLPLFSGSGCPSASHHKYLMFDVSTQISVL